MPSGSVTGVPGKKFSCDVTVGGQAQQVTITIIDKKFGGAPGLMAVGRFHSSGSGPPSAFESRLVKRRSRVPHRVRRACRGRQVQRQYVQNRLSRWCRRRCARPTTTRAVGEIVGRRGERVVAAGGHRRITFQRSPFR